MRLFNSLIEVFHVTKLEKIVTLIGLHDLDFNKNYQNGGHKQKVLVDHNESRLLKVIQTVAARSYSNFNFICH